MKKLLLLTVTALFILAMPRTNASATFQSPDGEIQCGGRVCLRATSYFVVNYKRIRFFPRDILISGVNLNHPVEVTSSNTILLALRNPSSASLAEFNRQYVTSQLSMAMIPLPSVYSMVKSSLACYGIEFEPFKLTNEVEITPETSLEALFTQCDLTAIDPPGSEKRDADMQALSQILAKLNGTCR